MDILLATIYSYPQKGGLGSYIRELAEELEQLGNTVDILACHPSFTGYYLVNDNKMIETQKIRTQPFYDMHPELFSRKSPMDPWVSDRKIERYTFQLAAFHFDLGKYDLIHTQDVIATQVLAEIIGYRTPIVQTIHGSVANELLMHRGAAVKDSEAWKYASYMDWAGVNASTVTIVPSVWFKNLLVQNSNAAADRIRVIQNGINANKFVRAMTSPTRERVPAAKKVIACIGHLSELKGQQHLLESLAKLKNTRDDWICWFIGDGPKRAAFEQLRDRLKLEDSTIFLGHREDVASLLSQTDIFVLPSLTENCPYSVIEAQVAGKPVIASSVGGIPEMIDHGVTGFLTPPADPAALAQTLLRLFEDEPLRRRVGQNCVQISREKWSIETMVRQINNIYRSIRL